VKNMMTIEVDRPWYVRAVWRWLDCKSLTTLYDNAYVTIVYRRFLGVNYFEGRYSYAYNGRLFKG